MVGQLRWERGKWGRGEAASLYGLPVFRVSADPAGILKEYRLRRAGRNLRRGGVLRVLTPPDFGDWPVLTALGLRAVSPTPLVRFKADELALAALDRRNLDPARSTVALRGNRVDRDLERAALELCPRVRRLIIDAPRGGADLSDFLRREFGVPVLPPEEKGALSLTFSGKISTGERTLALWGDVPDLGTLTLSAPALREDHRTDLSLLNALWQGGRLRAEGVKIVGIP